MAKVPVPVKLALLAATILCPLHGCVRNELLGTVAGDGGSATPPRFAPPTLVAALSDTTAIDEDPTFTGDLVELFFMSNRAGSRDIWTSKRASASDPWQAPARVTELDTADSDWAPAVSLDGLRIWFASDRGSVGQGQIWRASRASRAAAWDPPAAVAELASGSIDFAPAVDATETTMYLSSDRANAAATAGGANFDLYASTRAGTTAAWSWPAPIPGINSNSDEYDPFVAQGGLIVFFTSMRSGMGDIYWSSRRSLAEAFAPPVPLGDLNSNEYDSDSTLSPDLGYMMFSSTRSGNAEIYETTAVR
jgi:WD40-like Beta Propeller Repeat